MIIKRAQRSSNLQSRNTKSDCDKCDSKWTEILHTINPVQNIVVVKHYQLETNGHYAGWGSISTRIKN